MKELLEEILPQVRGDARKANWVKTIVRRRWRERIKASERQCKNNEHNLTLAMNRLTRAKSTYDRLYEKMSDNEHMTGQINALSNMLK